MPKSIISSVTVSQVWDDDSSTDIEISKEKLDTGSCIYITDAGESVRIYPESWPEIRDQIDAMMEEVAEVGE